MELRPQVSVRQKIFYVVAGVISGASLLAVGFWLGQRQADALHQANYSGQTGRITSLTQSLASEVVARRLAEQKLIVEQSTREALTRELARSQAESASRQESLALLDSFLTTNDRSRAARLISCDLQVQEGHKYRYRALLAQGINSATEFSGRLLVSVDYLRKGQHGRLVLGEEKPLPVKIKQYERMEGGIELPSEAIPQLISVQVLSADGHEVITQCQKKSGGV